MLHIRYVGMTELGIWRRNVKILQYCARRSRGMEIRGCRARETRATNFSQVTCQSSLTILGHRQRARRGRVKRQGDRIIVP